MGHSSVKPFCNLFCVGLNLFSNLSFKIDSMILEYLFVTVMPLQFPGKLPSLFFFMTGQNSSFHIFRHIFIHKYFIDYFYNGGYYFFCSQFEVFRRYIIGIHCFSCFHFPHRLFNFRYAHWCYQLTLSIFKFFYNLILFL